MFSIFMFLSTAFASNSDDNWRKGFSGGYMEVRYGLLNYESEVLTDIFGSDGDQVFLVDVGTSMFRLVDVGVGFGRSKSQGYLLAADGSTSSEIDELRVIPLSGHITGRAHFWHEQLIIPFGGYGMDYWLWKETWGGEATTDITSDTTSSDTTETADTSVLSDQKTLNGGKMGSHYRFGVKPVLDSSIELEEQTL